MIFGFCVLPTGLEPAISTLKAWRLDQFAHRSILLHAGSLPQFVTRRGFEPLFPDPYSGILPLNDRANIVAQTGIEPIAPAYETGVLPLQPPRNFCKGAKGKSGDSWSRTNTARFFKPPLYLWSYIPSFGYL